MAVPMSRSAEIKRRSARLQLIRVVTRPSGPERPKRRGLNVTTLPIVVRKPRALRPTHGQSMDRWFPCLYYWSSKVQGQGGVTTGANTPGQQSNFKYPMLGR